MKKVKSFFNMKKLVLGALACAALVLLMPGEAKANEVITATVNVNYTGGKGCSWNANSSILTLDGATISVTDGDGISLGSTGTIKLVGNNTITVTGNGNGISSVGGLDIIGSGTLTIKVESGYGIKCYEDVTITDGATLEIENTTASSNSKIYSQVGNISIKDSNVTIYGKSNSVVGNGNGLLTGSSGEIRINNSEVYIEIIDSGSDNHCLEPGGIYMDEKYLFIKTAPNLKVTYTQGSEPETINGTITDSDKDELCAYVTKKVIITYKNSSTPGTTPSDNKSDDKKNESSPFHKFETDSIKEAKASGKIDATGGWKSFDRGTLNELSKLGKDISVTYDFNGHTYCVVVPKGFDPQKLVNEEGYCGFLYLAKVYGAVMIK